MDVSDIRHGIREYKGPYNILIYNMYCTIVISHCNHCFNPDQAALHKSLRSDFRQRYFCAAIRYPATCQDTSGAHGDPLGNDAQLVLCFIRAVDPQETLLAWRK